MMDGWNKKIDGLGSREALPSRRARSFDRPQLLSFDSGESIPTVAAVVVNSLLSPPLAN